MIRLTLAALVSLAAAQPLSAVTKAVRSSELVSGTDTIAAAINAKDYVKARQFAEAQAAEGDVLAQYYLGLIHRYGWGTKQDYEHAVRWYRLAAEKGQPDAQNNLGVMYRYGWGKSKIAIFHDKVVPTLTPQQKAQGRAFAEKCRKMTDPDCEM